MITEILLTLIVAILCCIGIAALKMGRKVFSIISDFLPSGVFSQASEEEPCKGKKDIFKSWKFILIKHKYYFDSGNAIMSYPTKVMLVFGFGTVFSALASLKMILLAGLGYGILLYIFGRIYIDGGFLLCEQEVRNINDEFVKEIRKRKSI